MTAAIRTTVVGTEPEWTVNKSRPPIATGTADDGGSIYEGSLVGGLVATESGGFRYVTVEVYAQILGISYGLGGADDHVHQFILSHDGTAATRVLLHYGTVSDPGFKIELNATHKVVFSAWDGSAWDVLTSSGSITTDTPTLLIVSIENYGGKINVYLGDQHQGSKLVTLTSPTDKALSLGGAWNGESYVGDMLGVTVDYYVMTAIGSIISEIIEAVVDAPATTEPAPTPSIADALMLVRADAAPTLKSYYSKEEKKTIQVYDVPNIVTNSGSVHYGADGGPSLINGTVSVDLTDGKFGGGCLSIPNRTTSLSYLPHREPVWDGFHDVGLGTRDFTLAMWIKSDGRCYVASSQGYLYSRGYWTRYGGITITLVTGALGAVIRINVGKSRFLVDADSPYKKTDGSSQSDALIAIFSGFPTFTANQWEFLSLCRKGGKWYPSIAGRFPTKTDIVEGSLGASIQPVDDGPGLFLGKAVIPYDGNKKLKSMSYAVKIDDAVFIADEALYTQEFVPPTARFEI